MKMRNLLAMSLLTAVVATAAVPVFAEEETEATETVTETEEATTEATEAVTEETTTEAAEAESEEAATEEAATEEATTEVAAEEADAADPISIKVLILPKFENGEMTGDFPARLSIITMLM